MSGNNAGAVLRRPDLSDGEVSEEDTPESQFNRLCIYYVLRNSIQNSPCKNSEHCIFGNSHADNSEFLKKIQEDHESLRKGDTEFRDYEKEISKISEDISKERLEIRERYEKLKFLNSKVVEQTRALTEASGDSFAREDTPDGEASAFVPLRGEKQLIFPKTKLGTDIVDALFHLHHNNSDLLEDSRGQVYDMKVKLLYGTEGEYMTFNFTNHVYDVIDQACKVWGLDEDSVVICDENGGLLRSEMPVQELYSLFSETVFRVFNKGDAKKMWRKDIKRQMAREARREERRKRKEAEKARLAAALNQAADEEVERRDKEMQVKHKTIAGAVVEKMMEKNSEGATALNAENLARLQQEYDHTDGDAKEVRLEVDRVFELTEEEEAQLRREWKTDKERGVRMDPHRKKRLAQSFVTKFRLDRRARRDHWRNFLVNCIYIVIIVSSSAAYRSPSNSYSLRAGLEDMLMQPFSAGTAMASLFPEYAVDQTSATTESFNSAPFTSWRNIGDYDEFWSWMEGPFLNGLFPTQLYEGFAFYTETSNQFYTQMYNRILGVRLRQLRVSTSSCVISNQLSSRLPRSACYGPFTKRTADTSDYGIALDTSFCTEAASEPLYCQAFRHRKATVQKGWTAFRVNPFSHIVKDDNGSGHSVDILMDTSLTQTEMNALVADLITGLQSNTWIDFQTRVVYITFNVYNSYYDMFMQVDLKLYVDPSGAISTNQAFNAFRVIRFSGNFYQRLDVFMFSLSFLMWNYYCVLLVYKILTLMFWTAPSNFRAKHSRSPYTWYWGRVAGVTSNEEVTEEENFTTFLRVIRAIDKYILGFPALQAFGAVFSRLFSFWTLVDALIVCTYAAMFLFRFYFMLLPETRNISTTNLTFYDYNHAVGIMDISFFFEGVGVFLSCMRTFKYFRKQVNLYIVWATLLESRSSLQAYLLFFMFVFTGFVFSGVAIFGQQIPSMSGILIASETLLLLALGDVAKASGKHTDTELLWGEDNVLAQFFIMGYIFVFYFVMLNVFIGILLEGHNIAMKKVQLSKEELALLKESKLFAPISTKESLKRNLTDFYDPAVPPMQNLLGNLYHKAGAARGNENYRDENYIEAGWDVVWSAERLVKRGKKTALQASKNSKIATGHRAITQEDADGDSEIDAHKNT